MQTTTAPNGLALRATALLAALLATTGSGCSCGATHVRDDAGGSDAPTGMDTGTVDAGEDAATADAPGTDTPSPDGGRDAGSVDAAGLDGGTCACGPESCGTRVCGRSDCGYPCGTCGSSEYCAPGGRCAPGGPPGPTCTDAFSWPGWGRVHYGDRGLRRCPTDPTMVELCTCSTGGPDSWMDCTGDCFTPCFGGVSCGATTCSPVEYCQVCGVTGAPTTFTCRSRSATPGCGVAGLDLYAMCDEDSDCGPLDRCVAVRGDYVRLGCEPAAAPTMCGTGAFYQATCDDLTDCPACATACEEVLFADVTTPSGYGVNVCR